MAKAKRKGTGQEGAVEEEEEGRDSVTNQFGGATISGELVYRSWQDTQVVFSAHYSGRPL